MNAPIEISRRQDINAYLEKMLNQSEKKTALGNKSGSFTGKTRRYSAKKKP